MKALNTQQVKEINGGKIPTSVVVTAVLLVRILLQ
jgi:lactobin A/cerein 7B family class IIb bacteriocin